MSERIAAKVRDLLRLAANAGSEAEAATATARAQALVERYRLASVEANLEETEAIINRGVIPPGRTKIWERDLLGLVAQLNDCELIWVRQTKVICNYRVIGHRGDVDLVQEIFETLRLKIGELAEQESFTLKDERAFRLGVVHRICERMKVAKQVERESASSRAIVLVNRRAEKVRRTNPYRLIEETHKTVVEPTAYAEGQLAGDKIALPENPRQKELNA